MRIIKAYPPNIEELKKHFTIHETTVYTYGDIIYSPGSLAVTDNVVIHEEVHEKQQKGDPESWWKKYIEDKEFRFEQELQAYRAQYRYVLKKTNRNQAFFLLDRFAKDLSGELYGSIISYEKALRMIKL